MGPWAVANFYWTWLIVVHGDVNIRVPSPLQKDINVH